MSLHSVANRLCLEVPAASLRATAAAAALPLARDGAQGTPRLLDVVDLLATCRSHVTNHRNTCVQVNLCGLRVANPARRSWASQGSSLDRGLKRATLACSSSCGRCLLPASWKKDSPASSRTPLPQG